MTTMARSSSITIFIWLTFYKWYIYFDPAIFVDLIKFRKILTYFLEYRIVYRSQKYVQNILWKNKYFRSWEYLRNITENMHCIQE